MTRQRRNPGPSQDGAGVSEISARRLNKSEIATPSSAVQLLSPSPVLDPQRHTIIAAHFFGLRPGVHGGWEPIGNVSARVVDAIAQAREAA